MRVAKFLKIGALVLSGVLVVSLKQTIWDGYSAGSSKVRYVDPNIAANRRQIQGYRTEPDGGMSRDGNMTGNSNRLLLVPQTKGAIISNPDTNMQNSSNISDSRTNATSTDILKQDQPVINPAALGDRVGYTPRPGQLPLNPGARLTMSQFRERAKTDEGLWNKIINQKYYHPNTHEVLWHYFRGGNLTFAADITESLRASLQPNYDITSDTIIFLHIQKTGGLHLNERFMSSLHKPFSCSCFRQPCGCKNKQGRVWMYTSAFSGWPCGLHADWTQMHQCIPGEIDKEEGARRNRRYFYMTQLRDPIDRYMSEFNHQTRTNHWQDAILGCGGGFPDWSQMRPCFHSATWTGVSLDEFIECPHNLATNRMARMLADLTLTDCYRKFHDEYMKSRRALSWVKSAKENLQKMEYFGFMEQSEASDKLFESVYKIGFNAKDRQKGSGSSGHQVMEAHFLRILQLAELDFHIYVFAKELFKKRLEQLK